MDIVIAVRSTPLFGTAPVAAILLSLAAVAAADPLSRADSLYALRAMGAEGHRAKPQPIAAAIAAYSEIAATHPRELAAQWRLLRALFFEAQYTDRSAEERKRLLRQARDRAESAVKFAPDVCGGERLWTTGTRAELAGHCDPSDAARLYFWSAIAWAQWGRENGALAVLRSGLASRLFAYGTRVIELDPECEQGGGLRLLSGLHGRLPKIPFVSGFVRRDQALPLAAQALALDPAHPGNRLLYARTLLRTDPHRRAEALAMLERLAAEKPDGVERVERSDLRRRASEALAAQMSAEAP